MIAVAGTWELGWSAPVTEFDQWWSVLRSFEIEGLCMTPVTGLQKKMLLEFHEWGDILEHHDDLTPVFIDENAGVSLVDFEHPEKALYVLGKANHSPFSTMSEDHVSVRIDCPKMGMLWPHQALAIVLYDRGLK